MEPGDLEKITQKVDEAIHQGGTLAGRFGAKIPRVIKDLMQPDIDWREVLQDFWNSHVRGADEYTWRKFNKRRVADDIYLPSAINETIGEVILAIDTSGSIDNTDIAKVASRIQELCDTLPPERIRILWWDTEVHGEQVFEGNYSEIGRMLKPIGGGGTRARCVSDYIVKNNLNADCMVVFTDGYVEDPVIWNTNIPAIWIIKEGGREEFVPPSGGKRVVMKA
jgi:predicted metal-dependent peptidase